MRLTYEMMSDFRAEMMAMAMVRALMASGEPLTMLQDKGKGMEKASLIRAWAE